MTGESGSTLIEWVAFAIYTDAYDQHKDWWQDYWDRQGEVDVTALSKSICGRACGQLGVPVDSPLGRAVYSVTYASFT